MALTAKKVYAILKRQISNMEAKLNSPVRYRGTVATADLLPLNPDIGDMYNIESKSVYGEAGMNVAWNGVVWDTMGAAIDMSLYIKSSELADWVKQQNKPTYTAEEVGALSADTKIPSKTSDLQNDSGFLTKIPDNYLSGTDKTLSVSGKAADAKTVGDKNVELLANILSKLDKNQGSENSGKIAGINESGDIVPMFPVSVDYNEETNCLEFGSDQKMELNKGINLDSTLTKTGYAADAGTVGKITNSLKEDIDNIEGIILPLKYINIFNKENIVKGKIYSPYVNAKDTEFQIVENGFYSTDKYFCKQGDVIYYSAAYIYMLIYDKNGNCVEVFNPTTTGSVIVSNSNAYYLRYACSASDKVYVDRFALSINKALPDIYIPYGVTWEQYNNNKNFYMSKVIVSVDYSFSEITNPHITYGLENGIRFVFNGQSENARTLLKKGCDLGTYSNDSDYLPDFSTINSENDKDLKAWDDYVKHALSLQEAKGFVRPVLWECCQLQYGTALEKALKNNGYIYARGGQSSNGFYPVKNVEYQQFDCITPTDTTLDVIKRTIDNCIKESKTICILLHRVLDNVPDGDTWDISTEYYQQIVDYLLIKINSGDILNVTPNELYNLSNPNIAHIRDTEKIINLIN